MPRPRFQRLEPERAARILEVAAEQFATFGYAGASLNRILAMLFSLDQAIDTWMLAHPEAIEGPAGEALARRTLSALRRLLEPA